MPNDKTTPQKNPNERGCYCAGIDAGFRRKFDIADGYCGVCERCGKPGHTRHFPGPVPYTGAWCDRCYRIVAFTWWLRSPTSWLIFIVFAAMLWPFLSRYFK